MSSDHDTLIAVTRRWEKLYAEAQREIARLREKNDRQMRTVSDAVFVAEEVVRVRKEAAALRALISWVDGMLVDEAAPMVIREGIYTALEMSVLQTELESLRAENVRLREEVEFLQQDIETIVDTVAELLGIDGGDIDGDGDQGGVIANFIRQIPALAAAGTRKESDENG